MWAVYKSNFVVLMLTTFDNDNDNNNNNNNNNNNDMSTWYVNIIIISITVAS